ncbi:MAG: helix-turn-helix domain-containing protein [Raoultibacter sp.]
MKFDERLYTIRKSRGLSQEELGQELEVSRQTISKWESGQSYPDFQRLVLLSDYFDMTLDELVRGLDVQDVRDLNRTDERVASMFSDVEQGKDVVRKMWKTVCIIGWATLAFFAVIVVIALVMQNFF